MKCKLGEVCDFQNGYAFKSKDFLSSGRYKVIKIKELKDGEIRFFNDSAYIDNFSDSIKQFIVNKGDVLFALTGDPVNKNNPLSWVGRISRYNYDEIAFINQRVCKVLVDEKKLDKDYLYYFFRLFDNFYSLAQKATGSANQANISTKTIADMEIDLPPVSIQQAIAITLSLLDDKITNNKKINHHLEQMAQAKFDDMFPSVSFGDSTVGEYITPKRGKTLISKEAISGEVPVIAGGLVPTVYHNVANTQEPVITISASGANAGFVNLWSVPVWSSDSSFIDKAMTDDVYFWYVMLKKRQSEIYESQTGSAQPHIYPSHIAGLPTIALDKDEIVAFTEFATPLFDKIAINLAENLHLASLRDTLLPRLMTGELSVADLGADK